MATVVRLKRRRDEDPLEVLLLAAKKHKGEQGKEDSADVTCDKSVFKFAGTVSSKDDGISRHVREAIRKEKLEREYRQHQSNILGTVRKESRQHKNMKSQQNRFKITSKHRALDLDCLDKTDVPKEEICQKCGKPKQLNGTPKASKAHAERRVTDNVKEKFQGVEAIGDCNTQGEQTCKCKYETVDKSYDKEGNSQLKENVTESENDPGDTEKGSKGSGRECVEATGQARDPGDGLFCLVDVETENAMSRQPATSSTTDQITCNSEPMEREIVSERSEDDDYVYDIYYTNSRQFDFRMFERDLTFEAFSSDLMFDREMVGSDDEFVYEDEEDENAESNWRNDYPDEDPQYFENENSNYFYGNELDDYVAFETETGNQLADWMSWRCNIDGAELSSDDEEVEHYGDVGTSYNSYYRHVRKEMGEEGGESDDS